LKDLFGIKNLQKFHKQLFLELMKFKKVEINTFY